MRNGESWVFRGRRRIGSEADFAPGLEALGLHPCRSLEEPFVVFVSAGSSCPTEPGILQGASPEGDCWRSHRCTLALKLHNPFLGQQRRHPLLYSISQD